MEMVVHDAYQRWLKAVEDNTRNTQQRDAELAAQVEALLAAIGKLNAAIQELKK
jgi:hypothetical protein